MADTQQAYVEAQATPRLNWGIFLFLVLTPIAAISMATAYVYYEGFRWTDVIPFFVMYELAGLAITAGYHRYFAHRTHECHPIVKFFYLILGAAAVENSLLVWASDHRYHHQYADRDGDPYNVRRGFWWAHMGWMFYMTPRREFHNSPDLKKDRLVMWQHRNYALIAFTAGFILPTLIGALFGRPLAGFIWGGAVRMVVLQHITFLINSAAHTFGRRTYDPNASAASSHWLGAISFGEGYHSYHHAFASDYRIGVKWYQIDQGKWLIGLLERLGLAWNLKRTPQAITHERLLINRAKAHA